MPKNRQVPPGDLGRVQEMLGLKKRNTDFPLQLRDAVFVCVDCEAFEFDQNKITEVGVSIYDTQDVSEGSLESTPTAEHLISKIKSSHYRVEEYKHLRNRRYIKGDPDAFAFGDSIWIKRSDVKDMLEETFRSVGSPSTTNGNDTVTAAARNIVLVGHSLKNDIDFLRKLNFHLDNVPNIILKIDTQNVATPKKRAVGLKKLLVALDIESTQLHNAGNDAAYTLRALLTTAVKEHFAPGSTLQRINEGAYEGPGFRTQRFDGKGKGASTSKAPIVSGPVESEQGSSREEARGNRSLTSATGVLSPMPPSQLAGKRKRPVKDDDKVATGDQGLTTKDGIEPVQ